jgi:hypothetical protein
MDPKLHKDEGGYVCSVNGEIHWLEKESLLNEVKKTEMWMQSQKDKSN